MMGNMIIVGFDGLIPIFEDEDKVPTLDSLLETSNSSEKPNSCDTCKHNGKWEDEYEYGYPSPCAGCAQRASSHYEPKDEPRPQSEKDEKITNVYGPTDTPYTDIYPGVWEWRGDNWYYVSGNIYHEDEEMPRCRITDIPFDECGFCDYFNCDTCKCEADKKAKRSE